MIKVDDKKKCCGCSACFNVCPRSAITMLEDSEGFLYPNINTDKCINCHLCEKACPQLNDQKLSGCTEVYAAYNIDDTTRLKSSSGGVFRLLSKQVLENNGYVYGAAFDESWEVYHRSVDSIDGLDSLMSSKYVQSDIGMCYKDVKEKLEADVKVLFSGTPCQVAGLKQFLRKNYDNLLCVDIVCHGVPSRLVWRKYLTARKGEAGKIGSVTFRSKARSWKNYNVKFSFKGKDAYDQLSSKDLYMQGFLQHLYLRPSCSVCKFKGVVRCSDITLADFWGIEYIDPLMDDDKGTSAVVIHTEKGSKAFEHIKGRLKYKDANIDDIVKYNPSIVKASLDSDNRDRFMNGLADEGVDICRLIDKNLVKPKWTIRRIVGGIYRRLLGR